ncbi:MAG: ABC transporter permease [Bacteroidia bacterium]
MFDQDRWQEIYSALSRNKLRTFLTAFGVFWGILMLIIMLGSGNGLSNGITRNFSGLATNSFFLWTQQTTKSYAGLPPGRNFWLRNEDLIALRDQVPEAVVIAPRNQLGGHRGSNNVMRGTKSGAFSVAGDYPEIRQIKPLDIVDGRFLNHPDIEEKRKVAVIGTRVQQLLFDPDEEPIGDYIRINGVYFKVVGIFATPQSGERADRENLTIYIPFSSFQNAFNYNNRIGWFAFLSSEDVPAALTEQKVRQVLSGRHRIHPDDERAFGSWGPYEEMSKINGLFLGITTLIWIVGIGTLMAGVIGVSNIMLIIVKERTREIGVRRALGATPLNIVSEIIFEAVMLTALAGYLGLVAGVILLEAIGNTIQGGMFYSPEVNLGVTLQALAILIVAGAMAGIFPAFRAVSVQPVDALRAG